MLPFQRTHSWHRHHGTHVRRDPYRWMHIFAGIMFAWAVVTMGVFTFVYHMAGDPVARGAVFEVEARR